MRTQSNSNENVEMYLKTVAELGGCSAPVSIANVADRLDVTAVSANEMMKRLTEQGFICRTPYKGVELTTSGRIAAYSVIRRQRLWERFLVDNLNLSWAGAYEASCRLEHATSNVLAESLAAYLGNPTVCPHGHPIPTAAGTLEPLKGRSLLNLKKGESGHVEAIMHTTTTIAAYLDERNILPQQKITVKDIAPLDGPLTIIVGSETVILGQSLADLVIVV